MHTNDVHGRIVEEKGRDKNTSVVGDEAKKYKQILKFPLLSSKGYNTVETSKKDGITTHVYGVKKSRDTNIERKLPNTGINSVATASFGVVALLTAVLLRKKKK